MTLRRSVALLLRNRQIALIAVVVAAAEIFGFSSLTLMPSFARDVFGIGAAGLGWMVSARAIGGTLGLLAIATTTSRWRTVGTLTLLAGVFGLALLLFSMTLNLAIALVLAGVIGAAGGAVDAVGQAQMQHAVPAAERGSAMGAWMFCVGLGLVGHVEIGTLGARTGAPFAQGLNGAALVLVALVVGAALLAIRARWAGMLTESSEYSRPRALVAGHPVRWAQVNDSGTQVDRGLAMGRYPGSPTASGTRPMRMKGERSLLVFAPGREDARPTDPGIGRATTGIPLRPVPASRVHRSAWYGTPARRSSVRLAARRSDPAAGC